MGYHHTTNHLAITYYKPSTVESHASSIVTVWRTWYIFHFNALKENNRWSTRVKLNFNEWTEKFPRVENRKPTRRTETFHGLNSEFQRVGLLVSTGTISLSNGWFTVQRVETAKNSTNVFLVDGVFLILLSYGPIRHPYCLVSDSDVYIQVIMSSGITSAQVSLFVVQDEGDEAKRKDLRFPFYFE